MGLSKTGENGKDESLTNQHRLRAELVDDVYGLLNGLSNMIDEQSREIEKLTGLSKNQALTIRAVSRSPSASVTELAKSMYLNPATMVRILDRLEEQGIIARIRSKEDRRVVKIGMTDKFSGIEKILRTITHDSLLKCLATTNDNELSDMLGKLQKLSSLFGAAYINHNEIVAQKC
ncbi:MAG: MarR family transcriptional regulator [Desulfuromonadaceae bacterium]|nr:MarR family transcriptional regulator [Desulfuromonadaceae bacterium]MDD2846817.1 MarR family transcriptional regulator [Desulfuromonadaceae bacterium]MDD4129205.1 MarR family transcriptional regulator [Desulfuromonadaceae bacterium]